MPRGNQEVVRLTPSASKTERFAQPPALTASARVYNPANAARMLRKGGNHRARSREWQHLLWQHYDIVPEYRSGCDWVGNSLSKAKITIWKDGELLDNQLTRDILASFFGGIEGQAEMLRLFGVNFSVAGEAWIIGIPGGREDGLDEWKVVAATEITGEDSAGMRHLNVEGERIEDPRVLPIRIWKAHPRRSEEANSPSRALLSTLNQIVKLTQVIDAQADSRLISAGILFVPSEIEMPTMTIHQSDGSSSTQEIADSGQALYQMLVDNASVAIEKRDSAAAQVPLVISAPGEFLKEVNKVEFWSGFDEYVKDLRDEAIRRIAVGMDMPPEVLTGTAEVNHWGAWQIEEAAIKSYMEPLLDIIVASLTTGYLRPYLESQGITDAESYQFKADTSQMRLRPNRSKEAIELWDRGVISTRSMMIENGFDPDADAMPPEEKVIWLIQKVGTGNTSPEMVANALELLGVKNMLEAARSAGNAGDEARPTRSLEEHPHRGAPNPEESEAEDAVVASAGSAPFFVDGLVLASEQMVFRALERAGNRLKGRFGRSVTPAIDYYMAVPQPSRPECEELLRDAWTTIDRFDYPGVDRERLREALAGFTTSLLRTRRPYDRASLARYLMMEMAEESR
jgi:hypothetical protein